MTANNAIIVNYPNKVGDNGRYRLSDQRNYFNRFDGGSSAIFELALQHSIDGDLLSFYEQCSQIFDNYYQLLFDDNTISVDKYNADYREYYRRIFDLYRYAKTSIYRLGENHGLSLVKCISSNHQFDTGSFLLR